MVKIADLICGDGSRQAHECGLVVGPDTPVSEALRRMEELGCDSIAVRRAGDDNDAVISRDEVLHSLLVELEKAQVQLSMLQRQIEGSISEQIDNMQEGVKSLVEWEKDKLAVAIDNMSEGLIILGRTGEIERANPAAKTLLGLTPKDSLEALATVIDGLGFRELIGNEGDPDEKKQGEFKVRSASGKILQMRWNEMIDDWDNCLGTVVMIRDVTDEDLAEKAKTEFIASISHELRTPLTSIQNSVSNILADVTGRIPNKTREYLHGMKSDCHRFAGLINNLLDMAILEAGSMPINRRVMNIVSVATGVIRQSADLARTRNIDLTCEISGHVSPVYADPQRIGQVLSHLITNAIKFTEPRGRVVVRSCDSGDDVVTMVEDTGVGIEPELQKQIFSKFFQISRRAGAGSMGSGLGLAISNGIIAVHGGAIWVESRKGEGSRFYFSLPKTDPFVMLYRHLSDLASRTGKEANDFALMILGFDVAGEQDSSVKTQVGSIINGLLAESDDFLVNAKDLAIQTEDFEVVFVVEKACAKQIEMVRRKIQKIVGNRLRKNCGNGPILPMLGIGVYPTDAIDARDMEDVARRKVSRLLD
ncbi:MAG: hypothetical protein DRP66_10085 [Planctomycetota bacterium]|nr:MAG: hypothetical protein DRP66_10085 [Planctomycetota bacterium]